MWWCSVKVSCELAYHSDLQTVHAREDRSHITVSMATLQHGSSAGRGVQKGTTCVQYAHIQNALSTHALHNMVSGGVTCETHTCPCYDELDGHFIY